MTSLLSNAPALILTAHFAVLWRVLQRNSRVAGGNENNSDIDGHTTGFID